MFYNYNVFLNSHNELFKLSYFNQNLFIIRLIDCFVYYRKHYIKYNFDNNFKYRFASIIVEIIH